MRPLIYALAATAAMSTPALAEIQSRDAEGSVPEVMDRLVAAVESAGAQVFARVDHAQGAASVDMELPPAQLLIFGNPKLGTLPMQDDIRAGLFLPLRVLVHAEGEDSRIVWQEPQDMFRDLTINADAQYMTQIAQALEKFADAASTP